MKVYSDKLTTEDLFNTVQQIPGMHIPNIVKLSKTKVRQNGWDLQTAGSSNRPKNSGIYGGSGLKAASYDDHGRWFALLYNIDPNAQITVYKNAEDFHKKTSNKYKINDPCLTA